MDLNKFNTKLANFVDKWHYPVDEDMHVNAPLKAPSIDKLLGSTFGGMALGGAIGAIPAVILNKPGIVEGSALFGGVGGALSGHADNKQRKADLANPEEVYERRRKEFRDVYLPQLQERELNYVRAMNQDNSILEEHAIRERYRSLHPERRKAEYDKVINNKEPSNLMKRATYLQEKYATILGKMLTTGKVTGAGTVLGAAGFTGYHLGRGVNIVDQQSPKYASSLPAIRTGFKGQDVLGKAAPYIDATKAKGLSTRAKALIAGATAGIATAGAAAYSNARKENLKGTDPEKVASFLSTAAKFIAKNPRMSMAGAGAAAGAGIGAVTASDGNRLSGAATGAMGGGALGLAGGNALKSKLDSMPKAITATQRPALNMQ